jgi:site-specific DNA recombinase
VLRNEAYIGHKYDGKRKNTYAETDEGRKVRYTHCPREEWIGVAVPAIIDMATWEKAQERRVRNKQEARRDRKYTYLLAGGRLRCGVCGYAMSPAMSQDRQARYRCVSSNRHYAAPHVVKSVMANQVESEVWARVERMVSHPRVVLWELERRQEQAGHQQERIDRDRQAYKRQLAKIEGERERLLEAYLGAALDLAQFKATDVPSWP